MFCNIIRCFCGGLLQQCTKCTIILAFSKTLKILVVRGKTWLCQFWVFLFMFTDDVVENSLYCIVSGDWVVFWCESLLTVNQSTSIALWAVNIIFLILQYFNFIRYIVVKLTKKSETYFFQIFGTLHSHPIKGGDPFFYFFNGSANWLAIN